MNAQLDHIEEHGGEVFSFRFQPERKIRFTAGQYIELYLPHEADNRGERRWFTISSSPSESTVTLTIRFPERCSTFKQTLKKLPIGSIVSLSVPLGDFVLPKDPSLPLIFVAAGTGCTPYVSMVRWLQEQAQVRDIHMIYGTGSPQKFLFSELWKSYEPLHLQRIVSRADSDWQEHIGQLDSSIILEATSEKPDALLYLAGPQSLIEPLYYELLGHIPRQQVLLDYFPGY